MTPCNGQVGREGRRDGGREGSAGRNDLYHL